MTTIKITELSDIGANIGVDTLLPVVNMTGTPTTEKATLSNLANAILSGAGTEYVGVGTATDAITAGTVTNGAQPNITSVGTLTSLDVDGNVYAGNISTTGVASITNLVVGASADLGDVGNVTIGGGSNGYVLSTDGAGNLSWKADANSSYGNSNVESYLPTYNGNLNPSNITANGGVVSTSPTTGTLKVTGGAGISGNIHGGGEIHSGGNVKVGGQTLLVGQYADVTGLTDPTVVIFHAGDQFIQAAIKNSLDTGSADWIAYGDNGTDSQGWADMGFTSSGFNDANYTITGAGDGYFFVESMAGSYGGNLVIATGNEGTKNDIIFATGGFAVENEFARIENSNNTLHISRANASITFPDGSVQTTAYTGGGGVQSKIANGTSNVNIATSSGAVEVTAGTQHWAFGTDGTLTAPNDSQIVPAGNNFNIYTNDVSGAVQFFTDVTGNNHNWSFDGYGYTNLPFSQGFSNTAVIATVGAGNIMLQAGAGPTRNYLFGSDGAVTFPTLTVDLHNGGNQSAQTLQFGDPNQQAVITGPTPAPDTAAQRLIIQGQRGNGLGEGGDVYVWAGDAEFNGGDIKIYAGDADDATAGSGGYINLDGGSGFNGGGQISVTGGYSQGGQGGPVYVSAGQGTNGGVVNINGGGASASAGGYVNIQGGFGQSDGGAVTIAGGGSALGLANYGNVQITAGVSTWTFNNAGDLQLAAGNGIISSLPNNAGDGSGLSTLNLYPDSSTSDDRYLILDPTGPSHLHLRAGGNIDASNVLLYLGGEQTYVQVDDGYHRVTIGSYDNANATGYNWRFDYDGNLVLPLNTFAVKYANGTQVPIVSSASGSNNEIQFNSNGAFGASGNYTFTDTVGGGSVEVGNELLLLGNGTISTASNNLNIQPAGNLVVTASAYNWTFDNTGNLSAPGYLNFSNASRALITYGANNYINLNNDYGIDVSCNTEVKITTNYGDAPNRAYSYFYANGTFSAAGNITTTGNITATNIGNVAALNLDGSSSNVLYGNGVFAAVAGGSSSNISNGNSNVNIATANGNVTIAAVGNSVMTITGTGANITGTANISGNANVGNLGVASVVATANISTTGYFISGNQATGGFQLGNSNSRLKSGDSNSYMTMGQSPAIYPDTAASATAGVLFGGNGYLLGNNGSRCITLNYGGGSGVVGLNANLQVGTAGSGTVLVPGTVTTGVNSVLAGPTFTPLANTMAGFVANVNYYSQLTIQNKNTGADATVDFIATADNGSDTVNYLDMGIINSGYDANTPTNSLGNIVFAADSYMYAQGNTGNASQSGGNLVIGTTVPGKNVKIFAGGVDNTAIVANIANTGVTVTGNLSVSGNISGNTAGFAIGYRDIPQVVASNTTLAATDGGKHYYSTTAGNLTLTIPNNATTSFATGTAISIVVQAAGNILVNAATGVTLYMAGNSTSANRVVGTYGMATLMKVASDTWFINGTGVS